MKNFLSALMIAFVVAFSANICAAGSTPVTKLKNIIGNWYDTKGNLVLSIGKDYKINGCTVTVVDYQADSAELYKIRINESNGYRDIDLITSGSYEGYHELLVLNFRNNNPLALRRTKIPRYVESVGGVYLGMDKNQVVSLYGQPSSAENGRRSSTWKYNKEGFSVTFEYGVVADITIYRGGNRRFDWSGLSASSSRADFAYKYNSTVSHRGNINIGHGELISISDNGVSLRCFMPGYVF